MENMSFILFGATGDLARRKIFPALFNLYRNQKLPKAFSIIGIGKEELSNKQFQELVIDSLYEYSRHSVNDKAQKAEFVKSITYISLDITKETSYQKLLTLVKKVEREHNLQENRIFYLSVSPKLFNVITTNIKKSNLSNTSGWKRVIIEKPFGNDLKTAQQLNDIVQNAFQEDEIFRIDHYLGKPMVKNLLTFVSANPMLQPLWNKHMIANIQITANEEVGVGSRASYYEQAGAVRDMFQNHMLQLIMMTAVTMLDERNAIKLRAEKVQLMETIRVENQHDVVRGQYTKAPCIKGYKDELGVDSSSNIETFFAASLFIENPLWEGVPFFVRTGKRLNKKETKIVIEFKNVLNNHEKKTNSKPNLLTIHINPDYGISLQLNSKNPITGELETITMNFSSNDKDIPEAYEYLLADAIQGDLSYFTHWDEVELAWKSVQPIIENFHTNKIPLNFYQAGSNGPKEADDLVNKHGYKWW
ncbi:glucose-6-phosphate dehydrogenase [Alkalihalobacillus trypoxylicola]|uniref:Glucose-6-phosphate 1-dehydrogenase n=1 Tax=Alkalihalobacillus trypoxylicola TaxID=519424 RepID=A0A162DGH0_9BACI|nr:glucose-6-phosphate dehydrogenase [Alkalihalobacillus trypoxylicola]KYG29554.1 glucose-6-phosphate dehydrogenase [Alkalihalobacillus trypoxylicola]